VSLHDGKHKFVYVFSSFVPVPFVAANIRTHTKLVQDVTAQSTINLDGSYCDEYSHATVHFRTLYKYSLLISIRAFPSDGRTTQGTSLLQYS
jgi:hypothetical protein